MTQKRKRKPRAPVDEGAAHTALVMTMVKRLRLAKTPRWSAERLAQEMTAAGVPWTRDAVVNLETARRKRLAAHELLALAYVLDLDNPLDLLVPNIGVLFPITPAVQAPTVDVRGWFYRETGPLRTWLEAGSAGQSRIQRERMAWQLRLAEQEAGMLRKVMETEPGDGA